MNSDKEHLSEGGLSYEDARIIAINIDGSNFMNLTGDSGERLFKQQENIMAYG